MIDDTEDESARWPADIIAALERENVQQTATIRELRAEAQLAQQHVESLAQDCEESRTTIRELRAALRIGQRTLEAALAQRDDALALAAVGVPADQEAQK